MYTIVIETPTLFSRTFLWSSRKVSNRISKELYRFRKRMGMSRSCSDIYQFRQKAKLRHVIESNPQALSACGRVVKASDS